MEDLGGIPLADRHRVRGFSPSGHSVAVTCQDGTARLWNSDSSKPIGEPLSHRRRVDCLVFNPDGTIIATGSRDGSVRLWDAELGLPIGPPFAQGRGAGSGIQPGKQAAGNGRLRWTGSMLANPRAGRRRYRAGMFLLGSRLDRARDSTMATRSAAWSNSLSGSFAAGCRARRGPVK